MKRAIGIWFRKYFGLRRPFRKGHLITTYVHVPVWSVISFAIYSVLNMVIPSDSTWSVVNLAVFLLVAFRQSRGSALRLGLDGFSFRHRFHSWAEVKEISVSETHRDTKKHKLTVAIQLDTPKSKKRRPICIEVPKEYQESVELIQSRLAEWRDALPSDLPLALFSDHGSGYRGVEKENVSNEALQSVLSDARHPIELRVRVAQTLVARDQASAVHEVIESTVSRSSKRSLKATLSHK